MKFSDEELTTYLRWQGLPKDFVAAERIEQLVATNGQLEKELHTSRMASVIMDNTVAEAESKLAKAVEAIQKMTEHEHCPYDVWKTGTDVVAELEKTE